MYLSDPVSYRIPGVEFDFMHLGSSAQKTVAFIGVPNSTSPGGFHCTGTAFFLHYDGMGYLVTARHCVEPYQGREYLIRINRTSDGVAYLRLSSDHGWIYHHDQEIDVAILPCHIGISAGLDVEYVTGDTIIGEEEMKDKGVDVGQTCYSVGLFRYIPGDTKNVPLVYTGNIALHGDEEIPLWRSSLQKTQPKKGALIQTPGIQGASGSPVFVRLPLGFADNALMYQRKVFLYGILVSAWFLPPDEETRQQLGAQTGDTTPVGLGIVVRTPQLIEVLEMDEVKKRRQEQNKAKAKITEPQDLAVPTADNVRAGDGVLGKMLNTPPKPHDAGG